MVDGLVELLGNGSAFVRLAPAKPTDDDVYVSAAQVKRCELVSAIASRGPVRAPAARSGFRRWSARTPSRPPGRRGRRGHPLRGSAGRLAPDRLALAAEDVTLKAVEWLTPFGKGSRVLIVAVPPRPARPSWRASVVGVLAGREGLELLVVLDRVAPGGDRRMVRASAAPLATLSFAASPDAQAQAIEQAVEQGRRVAARGGDAVVVIDTLEWFRRRPRAARWQPHATSPTAARSP